MSFASILIFFVGLVMGIIASWALNRRTVEKERLQRAVAETRLAELEKNLVSQQNLLVEAENRWKISFENLSSKALATLQEGARVDLGERQKSIESLLKPLQESLHNYQQRLQQNESSQSQTLGQVRAQIEALIQQSLSLSSETGQLRRALSSNQARGQWGEETLRRVVEAAGMSVHCDFTEQSMQGESKPDLVVRLPGDRVIVVDSKVPDLDFIAALNAVDEVKRKTSLQAHASKLKLTIKALADRNYPAQFPNALDYVVLFLPAESLFSAALEGDRDLIVWAAAKKILIATPASLIALLRAVGLSWQQNVSTENAQYIVEAGSELFDRINKFVEHLGKIRDGLERANKSFNDAVGSLESRVLPGADRLKKLGAAAQDASSPTLHRIEILPRIPNSPS